MAQFGRFFWTIAIGLLSACALQTEENSIQEENHTVEVKTNGSSTTVQLNDADIPCKTEVNLITSTGMIVTIYLECVKSSGSSPLSDEPGWGNENNNKDISTTGWTRPPPPGDPQPH